MADILARLKLRTGTFAAWTSANPILAAGEPGYEVDTGTLRIGDGSTAFLSLERFQTSDGFATTYQPLADNLTAFSGLTFGANKLPYGTGIGSFALTDLTAEARTFLAAASKEAQRASLNLADAAMREIDTSTNMTLNPTYLPTRAAVRGAILATGGPAKRIVFTASGTFVKADHGEYPDDHKVIIQMWGGGGGGNYAQFGGGGGGGGYKEIQLSYSALPASIPITIGAGGAVGAAGGNTICGALGTAFGGGPSASSAWEAGGGGGGGGLGIGGTGTAYSTVAGGAFGGGSGGEGLRGQGGTGGEPTNDFGGSGGGGGGGEGGNNRGGKGGTAIFGGAGGAGWGGGGTAVGGGGGFSFFGGNGGDSSGQEGVAPGGGGAHKAPGARGEVRFWL